MMAALVVMATAGWAVVPATERHGEAGDGIPRSRTKADAILTLS